MSPYGPHTNKTITDLHCTDNSDQECCTKEITQQDPTLELSRLNVENVTLARVYVELFNDALSPDCQSSLSDQSDSTLINDLKGVLTQDYLSLSQSLLQSSNFMVWSQGVIEYPSGDGHSTGYDLIESPFCPPS